MPRSRERFGTAAFHPKRRRSARERCMYLLPVRASIPADSYSRHLCRYVVWPRRLAQCLERAASTATRLGRDSPVDEGAVLDAAYWCRDTCARFPRLRDQAGPGLASLDALRRHGMPCCRRAAGPRARQALSPVREIRTTGIRPSLNVSSSVIDAMTPLIKSSDTLSSGSVSSA
jgi:hypothetical protein